MKGITGITTMAGKSSKAHPGFKAEQKAIAAKEGVPMQNASAILASASRKASPAAKRANPALMKVSGVRKAGKK